MGLLNFLQRRRLNYLSLISIFVWWTTATALYKLKLVVLLLSRYSYYLFPVQMLSQLLYDCYYSCCMTVATADCVIVNVKSTYVRIKGNTTMKCFGSQLHLFCCHGSTTQRKPNTFLQGVPKTQITNIETIIKWQQRENWYLTRDKWNSARDNWYQERGNWYWASATNF